VSIESDELCINLSEESKTMMDEQKTMQDDQIDQKESLQLIEDQIENQIEDKNESQNDQNEASLSSKNDELKNFSKEVRNLLNLVKDPDLNHSIKEFENLKIENKVQLRRFIELLFEFISKRSSFDKVPSNCEKLAVICEKMSDLTVQSNDKSIQFHDLLIEISRKEIDKMCLKSTAIIKKQDKEDAKKERAKNHQIKRKAKEKCFVCIKFISELYRINQLNEDIIDYAIEQLIEINDAESFKVLKSLLKLAGQKHENSAYKEKFDQQMNKLQDIEQRNELKLEEFY